MLRVDEGPSVVADESALLVGRTGGAAPPVALLDVDEALAGHSADPQARSVGQHPPPKLAGQDLKPVLQVSVPCAVVLARVLLSVDVMLWVDAMLSLDLEEEDDSVVVVVDATIPVFELALDVELVRVLLVEVDGGRVVVRVTVLLMMPAWSQCCSKMNSLAETSKGTYSLHPGM